MQNKFVLTEPEKLEALDYWKHKFPRVNGVTFMGEPTVDGHMICVYCENRDINDENPVWHCNICGAAITGKLWKQVKEKIENEQKENL